MEIQNIGLSISAAVIIAGLIILFFWKPIVDLLKGLRLRSLKYGDLTAYFDLNQTKINEKVMKIPGIDLTYDRSLTGPLPPKSPDQMIPSIIANIKKSIKGQGITEQPQIHDYLFQQCAERTLSTILLSVYVTIYGSQIAILSFVKTNKDVSLADIKVFYDDAVVRYPEWYKKYSFKKYLDYLTSGYLLMTNNGLYQLSGLGASFLHFLENSLLPPRPF